MDKKGGFFKGLLIYLGKVKTTFAFPVFFLDNL